MQFKFLYILMSMEKNRKVQAKAAAVRGFSKGKLHAARSPQVKTVSCIFILNHFIVCCDHATNSPSDKIHQEEQLRIQAK